MELQVFQTVKLILLIGMAFAGWKLLEKEMWKSLAILALVFIVLAFASPVRLVVPETSDFERVRKRGNEPLPERVVVEQPLSFEEQRQLNYERLREQSREVQNEINPNQDD